MADQKKTTGRGVVDSIYALRLKRYNEKGPGAARAKPAKLPSVDQLRDQVAKVKPKARKKKSKKRGRR
jgi:hypothetical protein